MSNTEQFHAQRVWTLISYIKTYYSRPLPLAGCMELENLPTMLSRWLGCCPTTTGLPAGGWWHPWWWGSSSSFTVSRWGILSTFLFIWNNCLQWEPVKYGTVEYPVWAHVIGFMISASSMMWIPGYACYYLYKTRGSLKEVVSTYSKCTDMFHNLCCRNCWKV